MYNKHRNTLNGDALVRAFKGLYPTEFETEMLSLAMAGYAADVWSEAYAARAADDKGAGFLMDCAYSYDNGKSKGRRVTCWQC